MTTIIIIIFSPSDADEKKLRMNQKIYNFILGNTVCNWMIK